MHFNPQISDAFYPQNDIEADVRVTYSSTACAGPVKLDKLLHPTKLKQRMKKRRKVTSEFKRKVTLEALREQQPIHEIAKRYQIHLKLLRLHTVMKGF